MGRILIVAVISLAFMMGGCEAFKNYYDAPDEDVLNEALGVEVPTEVPAEGVEVTDQQATDYGIDVTECERNYAISVEKVDEDAGENSGWSLEAESIVAEKLGPFTTAITIQTAGEKLSFTVKRTGEKNYMVCNVILEGCAGECLGVSSIWSNVKDGEIKIYKFNEGETAENAGYYNITFNESNMGDPGPTLEGTYKTNAN